MILIGVGLVVTLCLAWVALLLVFDAASGEGL